MLNGAAASPGVVEGLARVVRSVDQIGDVRDGEILVCGSTSPAWAPIFSKIKATVTDVGGVMSHAAIVAASTGCPRSSGPAAPPREIRTGQTIRVDGTEGTVTLLARPMREPTTRRSGRAAPRRRAALRRQEREPRRAARRRDPGAAGVRALDRGVRGVRATRPGLQDDASAIAGRRRGEPRDAMRARARSPTTCAPRSRSGYARARATTSPPVAVRSSAVGEDSAEATFAGQQETYLWVRGADDVCDAVRDCWASLYSPPAISYRARLGEADAPPAMGVTVQLMVDAEVSGRDVHLQPGERRPEHGRDQRELGARAGGRRRRGHARRLSREQGHAARSCASTCTPRTSSTCPDPSGAGAVRVEVPAERRERACLDAAGARAAGRGRHGASSATSARHQDIEWAIARDGDGDAVRRAVAAGHRGSPSKRGEAQAADVGDVAGDEHVRRRPAQGAEPWR